MKRNGKRVLFLIELREQKGREREREKYSPGSTERSGGGNRRLCCRRQQTDDFRHHGARESRVQQGKNKDIWLPVKNVVTVNKNMWLLVKINMESFLKIKNR